ncbi:ATP-dependent DNA helicase [Vagococcus zengguangii]|uniref:AAA+ ATPase domain-containing protein n=1 Tax=Vagococcus zengguangii TaxID=2571750 RepID=A0A4D7CWG7_9ENTE|nr:AAA family ATPase [Vagococcus zengguangii]QCI86336.1 hypothetical protein FA707_04870 [Vagococcus zengguangii]
MEKFNNVEFTVTRIMSRNETKAKEMFSYYINGNISKVAGEKNCKELHSRVGKRNASITFAFEEEVNVRDKFTADVKVCQSSNGQYFLKCLCVQKEIPASDSKLYGYLASKSKEQKPKITKKDWEKIIEIKPLDEIIKSGISKEELMEMNIKESKVDTIIKVLTENVIHLGRIQALTKALALNVAESIKILDKFSVQDNQDVDSIVNQIKSNPFILMFNYSFSFERCEQIFENPKIKVAEKVWNAARLYNMLTTLLLNNGGYYILKQELESEWTAYEEEKSSNVSSISFDDLLNYLINSEFVKCGLSRNDNEQTANFVTTNRLYEGECELAFEIATKLSREVKGSTAINIDGLSVPQNAAARLILRDFAIITGGPGTGKTTTCKGLIELIEKLFPNKKICLLAPTGKAAKRLAESTNREVMTVHKKLEIINSDDDRTVTVFDSNDIVIIDEASMLSTYLLLKVFRSMQPETKLILIGDVNQLPSIEYGKQFSDLLNVEEISNIRLRDVYRQQKDSKIIDISDAIINNTSEIKKLFEVNRNEEKFFDGKNESKIVDTVVKLSKKWKEKGNTLEDMLVLTPINNGLIGKDELNKKLQKVWNEQNNSQYVLDQDRSIKFYENDKVMQLVNDSDQGLVNGDVGTITKVIPKNDGGIVEVKFDNAIVTYDSTNLKELDLAYAYTVHKSQGSEAKFVILVSPPEKVFKGNKNLYYTAVTRAKEFLIVVGCQETFVNSCEISALENRHTLLTERVKQNIRKLKENSKWKQ